MTVFLKNALGFLARQLPCLMAGLALITPTGCGPSGSTVNDILDAQLRDQGVKLSSDTARILLVNQTQSIIELDVAIDGQLVTLTCTPADPRYEYTPTTCPTTIEIVQERRLNSSGAFTGGRNFNHNPSFVFNRGEFNCSSTVTIIFTEDETTPSVL